MCNGGRRRAEGFPASIRRGAGGWALLGGVALAASTAGCNGAGADGAHTDAFTGATWNGTYTLSYTCNGTTQTTHGTVSLAYTAKDDGIVDAHGGCPIDLMISGNTATMSNLPHCAQKMPSGGAYGFTYEEYSLKSDGHHLTGQNGGGLTITVPSVSGDAGDGASDSGYSNTQCTFTSTFTATR